MIYNFNLNIPTSIYCTLNSVYQCLLSIGH